MQLLIDNENEHLMNFTCEVCGKKLWKKEMKDIIIYIHGNI